MRPFLALTLAGSALLAPALTLAQAPPGDHGGPPKLDPRMPALYLAVGRDDPAGVKRALATGVPVDSRNVLQFTPLIFGAAANKRAAVEALLAGGADLEAPSQFGSALTLAEAEGNAAMAMFLLDRGAAPEAKRVDRIQPLMLAAWHGHTEVVSRLLERGAKVDATNVDNATALSYAARGGSAEAARLLLDKGAAVDAADARGWTPLMYAALNGRGSVVRLLLARGAKVNAREKSGRTALLLAASYSGDPDVIRALKDGGADVKATDSRGRTAGEIAAARGYSEAAGILGRDGVKTAALAASRSPRDAALAGLKALESTQSIYLKKLGCASCHHQSLALAVTGVAIERGFPIDRALLKSQIERCAGEGEATGPFYEAALKHPEMASQIPFSEIGEAVTGEGFMLSGLAAAKVPSNPGLQATALVLGRRQEADGRWTFILNRVPMQSSDFTVTALAIRVLKAYGPRDRASEIRDRIAKAKQWLLTAPAASSEDRAYRLIGLKWAGATAAEMQAAIQAIRGAQRPDGGWAELDNLRSDAYATGQALYSLSAAGGVASSDGALKKGLAFLQRTQDDDGTWFINKRAAPLNFYTDVGFPHGESQYASFAGTCWATMALIQASPASPTTKTATRR
jgi:ankyrin repeat protein